MTKLWRIYAFALLALTICQSAAAQNAEVTGLGNSSARTGEGAPTSTIQTISVRYENDKAWPRWSYANNREAHRLLTRTVHQLAFSGDSLRTMVIEGAASPIGSDEYNDRLALRRAKVLRDIISKMKGGDSIRIRVVSTGEDWFTFRTYIEQNYHRANRSAVLAILHSEATNNEKESRLKALDQGRTWRILVDNYMASARNAAVIRIMHIAPLAPKQPSFEMSAVAPVIKDDFLRDSTAIIKDSVATEYRYPVVALRSNLLVPALNIGVEVPIGTHWSVAADYYYPWVWPKRDNKDCFELLAWGIEGRYWFGRNRTLFDRLQGHSIGLYGYMGYYDFERNYHGHQGEFVNVGIDYTYAMAVGKKKTVHFEFSLGVGFIYSQARKYTVIEPYAPLFSDKITKKIGFFGPTKANISLVVPIFKNLKSNDKRRGDE